jgi:hypothetical protein
MSTILRLKKYFHEHYIDPKVLITVLVQQKLLRKFWKL